MKYIPLLAVPFLLGLIDSALDPARSASPVSVQPTPVSPATCEPRSLKESSSPPARGDIYPCFVPAAKARHKYMQLTPQGSNHDVAYWDAAGVRSARDEIDVDSLIVGPAWDGHGQVMTAGEFQRYAISCDWHTGRVVAASWWSLGNPATAFPLLHGVEPGSDKPFFAVGTGYEAQLIRRVCDKIIPAGPTFAAVEPAVAFARSTFETAAPPVPVVAMMSPRPPRPPGFEPIEGEHRYGLVVNEPDAGRLMFVDYAQRSQGEGALVAPTLWILAQDSWPNYPGVELRSTRYDCVARTVTVLSEKTWMHTGYPLQTSSEQHPPRTVTGSTVSGAELAAVCAGNAPTQTFSDINEALAYAQSLLGGQQN